MQTIFTLKQQVLNGEVITVPVQNSSNISTYTYISRHRSNGKR